MFIASGPIGLSLLLGGVAVVTAAFGIRGSAPGMGGRGTGDNLGGKLADQRREREEARREERLERGEED